PRGYAFCDGSLLAISQNTALFSLLGTTYGGDGRTTFALPDLRGRVAIHRGNGPGLSNYIQGQKGGEETVTLTTAQMPSHNHPATAHAVTPGGNSNDAAGNFWADDAGSASATYHAGPANAAMNAGAVTTANTGGSQAHPNVQPYLVINYIIALVGVFPSRS
ncbi:MAG: phage tail protein, partial [Gammaproteobacteria bacterium]|nr:phage tail protein [Gammaproteobacteria bacterium]